jgi:hypothetical protein
VCVPDVEVGTLAPTGFVPRHEATPENASAHEYDANTVLLSAYVAPFAGVVIVTAGLAVSTMTKTESVADPREFVAVHV